MTTVTDCDTTAGTMNAVSSVILAMAVYFAVYFTVKPVLTEIFTTMAVERTQ